MIRSTNWLTYILLGRYNP